MRECYPLPLFSRAERPSFRVSVSKAILLASALWFSFQGALTDIENFKAILIFTLKAESSAAVNTVT